MSKTECVGMVARVGTLPKSEDKLPYLKVRFVRTSHALSNT